MVEAGEDVEGPLLAGVLWEAQTALHRREGCLWDCRFSKVLTFWNISFWG